MARYRGDPADLVEFGTPDETGSPCIGSLIAILPWEKRYAYREERRAYIREMTGRPDITYAEYLDGKHRRP